MTSGTAGTYGGTGRAKLCLETLCLCLVAGSALLTGGCKSGGTEAGSRPEPESSAADISRPAAPKEAPRPSGNEERVLEEMLAKEKPESRAEETKDLAPEEHLKEAPPEEHRSDTDLDAALEVLARAGGESESVAAERPAPGQAGGAGPSAGPPRGGVPATQGTPGSSAGAASSPPAPAANGASGISPPAGPAPGAPEHPPPAAASAQAAPAAAANPPPVAAAQVPAANPPPLVAAAQNPSGAANPSPPAAAPPAPVAAGSPPPAAAPAPNNGAPAQQPAGGAAAPSPAPTRGPPAPAPQAAPPQQAPPAQQAPPRPPRPPGKSSFYTFFHKNSDEFLRLLSEQFPDLSQTGHAAAIEGKPRSVIFFGDDATIAHLTALGNEFDDLALKLERVILRPKFVDAATTIESLSMAGVANVWNRVQEEVTTNVMGADGKVAKTYSRKQNVFARESFATGAASPANIPAKVPYVFEMPSADPLQMPPVSTGKGFTDEVTIDFKTTSSTEKRGSIVAVGTAEDLERIQEFIDRIDQPARLVMLEVQLIELDANKFSDIGTDAFQAGGGHTIVGGALSFPGEPIPQPGIPGVPKRADIFVPPNVASGITGMFDDTSIDLPGRFMANVHLLIRTGDAKIKARPKILALDDRPSILHIGEDLPTFDSTGVSREVTGGNFVETVNRVTTQYVGFTLNMRPRITGEKEDEISLLLEVVSTRLQERQRVFAEDLLGIPNVTRRRFVGQTRVQNHRPIILGGLIQEEDAESVNKLPVVGEIPVIKFLFSRRQKSERRLEVILIITPHILTDKTPDRIATPKESIHFDTFDSVLFNDRYIIKGRDVQGIDPISKQPARTPNGKVFTEAEVIDLTLLKIVKDRKLVSKLGILDEYLPAESSRLGWIQRKYPERTVRYWSTEKKDIYFKAAAVVIENIKELNPDLNYQELVKPRREIVLPTTPYRMTLSYDKYRILKEEGSYLLRGERVDLSQATVEILKEVAGARSVREFADYLEKAGVKAENHGDLRAELERLVRKFHADEDLKAGDYPGLYRKLADLQIDFMVLATYFQENLADRYRASGAPNIGTFEKDLVNFLKTAVTISQRAKRLRELESRWGTVAGDADTGGEAQREPESAPAGEERR